MTARATSRATCAAHGLAFDSSMHSGCVVCRRKEPALASGTQPVPGPAGPAQAELGQPVPAAAQSREPVSIASRVFSGVRLLAGAFLVRYAVLLDLPAGYGPALLSDSRVLSDLVSSLLSVAFGAALLLFVPRFRSLRAYSYALLLFAIGSAWNSFQGAMQRQAAAAVSAEESAEQ